jgi:6-pyruvoyl-tetrahydropterin synthase
VALIELSAEKLDDTDRVIDFGVVKEIVGGWVNEKWDHTALLNSEDYSLYDFCMHEVMTGGKRPPYTFDKQEPTAEVIARELFEVSVSLLMDHGVKVVSVTVFETPNCSARFGMKP